MPVCKYLIPGLVITAEMKGQVRKSVWEFFIFHISDHIVTMRKIYFHNISSVKFMIESMYIPL